MRTIKEVSALTGVSARTLRWYDKLGLLPPTAYTEGGYRLYDDAALERLTQILLYRELEIPLKEICAILDRPDLDRGQVLDQQIALLEQKRTHLENLIHFAIGIKLLGVKHMDFSVFQKDKLDEYAARAKEQWGSSPQFAEFAQKAAGRTAEDDQALAAECMTIFASFGRLRHLPPEDDEVQALVRTWQTFVSTHFYQCSNDMLRALGQMYTGGGEFTKNIDDAGGEGTAAFVAAAIEAYCR